MMQPKGFRCQECGQEDLLVVDVRSISHKRRRRRYECQSCGARFNGIEVTEEDFEAAEKEIRQRVNAELKIRMLAILKELEN